MSPMNFLFVLQYPGYLRYFDLVIRGLLSSGHSVSVAYDSPHKQPEGAEALAGAAVTNLGAVPRRNSEWRNLVPGLRGAVDYSRYLDPRFKDADYLRSRMRKAVPSLLRPLVALNTLPRAVSDRLTDSLLVCERAVPPSGTLSLFIKRQKPDVVVVSPLVTDQCPQVDVVKAAQALGIPTAVGVASWDHLTTKGLMRIEPDMVLVWNPLQKVEALAYHRVREDRIVVTGAHPFDRWFGRNPSRTREEFCRRVNLPADRPIVLFVGSTASISNPDLEMAFVREWASRLRRQLDTRGLKVSILIRPHPFNADHWRKADISGIDHAAVYPRHAANPVNDADRADYFDSLYYSATVVGINTSAMIEAAIVGRTVHTVLAPAFAATQEGTLHFRYLLPGNGGFLKVASDLDQHVEQLAESLQAPEVASWEAADFVARFVRPHGLAVSAAPIAIQALESLAARRSRAAARMPAWLYPLRLLLWLTACAATGYNHPRQLRRSLSQRAKRLRKSLTKRFGR